MVRETVIIMPTPWTAVVVEVIKGGFELEGSIVFITRFFSCINIMLRFIDLTAMSIIGSMFGSSIRSGLVWVALHVIFTLEGMSGVFDGEVRDFRYGFSLCLVLC